VRKLGISLFLLFYTFSVAGLTVLRTEEWAAQRADSFKHTHRSNHGAGMSLAHKESAHQSQTKLHEDGSALITLVRESRPVQLETSLHHRLTDSFTNRNSRTSSSRAPPNFL
jgi:hypothetical protein